jgi:signal peptidase I
MPTSLFKPNYLKEADLLAKNARKLLHRKRDLLSDTDYAGYAASIDELETTTRNGAATDRRQVEEATVRLDKKFGKLQPSLPDSGWRENCEVLLVAFVLAIGLRSYFVQPFKIPTGSMEPTLNGITGHRLPPSQPLPGVFVRTFDSLWYGRTYVEAISAVDDQLEDLAPETRFLFMNYTRIICESGRQYLVHVPIETLTHPVNADGFGLYRGQEYRAGSPIVRGYVATGDKVFVDKFSYNFRPPQRADVFVFSTAGIAGIRMEPNVKSEFYIKRLGAVAGDTLRIDAPNLYLNGELATEPPFARVMSGTEFTPHDGYRGYSNYPGFAYLSTPADTFTVPPKSYFALGDNSYNSSDSRAWGRVPAENVVGRGWFVYWPFGPHWGFIH